MSPLTTCQGSAGLQAHSLFLLHERAYHSADYRPTNKMHSIIQHSFIQLYYTIAYDTVAAAYIHAIGYMYIYTWMEPQSCTFRCFCAHNSPLVFILTVEHTLGMFWRYCRCLIHRSSFYLEILHRWTVQMIVHNSGLSVVWRINEHKKLFTILTNI